ncbi:MAG: hypothetical protein LN413_07970 [Candidatus Thermoplasmatota archaeon]|nr:hypothetical protein [Candidatus Thermoplasmatota archaeon]
MGRDEDLAYAAGVMDGDGYFSITRDQPNLLYAYYNIKIGAVQLWPCPALRFLAHTLGGSLSAPMLKWTKRPVGRWEVWGRKAEDVTKELIRFLLVKKTQARLLLEFQKHKRQRDSRLYTDWRSRMERLRSLVLQANRGGLDHHSLPWKGGPMRDHTPSHLGGKFLVHAYLAGIMDSDGTFKIEKRRVKGMINPHYRIKIGAGQVAPSPAIHLLAKTFGGTVRVRDYGPKGHRPLARWSLFDKSAVPALEALLPYLGHQGPAGSSPAPAARTEVQGEARHH